MLFPASLALAALLAGCTHTTPPAADTREADATAIRQLEADWLKAYQAKDADKITSFYADDGSVFNTDMPIATGKADILTLYKKEVADKNFSVTFPPSDKVVVAKSGDMAYTTGTYTATYTKAKKAVSEKGKYVEVYMKQPDGSWKDVADISNPNSPPVPEKKKPASARSRRK
jgi:uncharacterized protein (TIGR02246 family)